MANFSGEIQGVSVYLYVPIQNIPGTVKKTNPLCGQSVMDASITNGLKPNVGNAVKVFKVETGSQVCKELWD